MKSDWLEEAKRVKKSALKTGSKELFFQPIFPGPLVELHYHKFVMDTGVFNKQQSTMLKASGVRRNILVGKWHDWGGVKPKLLVVYGTIVNIVSKKPSKTHKGFDYEYTPRFVATGAAGTDGKKYHNQINTLGLLHCRGLITPLPYSGWIATDGVTKASLEEKLRLLRDSIKKSPSRVDRLPAPIGIQLFDCLNGE